MTTKTRQHPQDDEGKPKDEVAEQEAAEAAEAAEPEPKTAEQEPDGPSLVRYVGDAGVREITGAQWTQAGAKSQGKTTWDADNGYALPITDFTPEALEILKRDRNIKTQ